MRTIPLSKLAKNTSRKFHFDKYEKVVFINTGDVLNNEFLHNKLSGKDTLPGQAKKSIKKGDILYSEIRPGNGRYLFVDKDLDSYVVSTKFMVIEANQDLILPEYLFLILTSSDVTEYFKVIAEARSGTFPQITFDAISHYEINTPNKVIQKEIVDYIFSLDKKIQLNTQTNQTLEAIAQAIFKSWFVDFDPVRAKAAALSEGKSEHEANLAAMSVICGKDTSELNDTEYKALWQIAEAFPSELVENEQFGEVPKGWEVKQLGELVTIKRGGSPRPIKDFISNEGLKWVKISDATAENSPFLFETKEFIKQEGLSKTVLLDKGSLILSNSATPGLPKFLDISACIHDGWLYFPKIKALTQEFLYFYFLSIRDALIAQGNGSVFTNLKTDILKSQYVIHSNPEIISKFGEQILPLMEKIKNNRLEIIYLQKIRDELLPKLLSGEIHL